MVMGVSGITAGGWGGEKTFYKPAVITRPGERAINRQCSYRCARGSGRTNGCVRKIWLPMRGKRSRILTRNNISNKWSRGSQRADKPASNRGAINFRSPIMSRHGQENRRYLCLKAVHGAIKGATSTSRQKRACKSLA